VAGVIASQRDERGIPVAVSCRALGVSRSWFYKWKDGDRSPRRARQERLKAEIARLFTAHKGKRGSPMITADLHDLGAGPGQAGLPGHRDQPEMVRRRHRGLHR
jgi:predicted DNA-binding transcriptional regulator AlpA